MLEFYVDTVCVCVCEFFLLFSLWVFHLAHCLSASRFVPLSLYLSVPPCCHNSLQFLAQAPFACYKSHNT